MSCSFLDFPSFAFLFHANATERFKTVYSVSARTSLIIFGFMPTSLPHFASSEHVRQWLAATQPEPSAGMETSKDSRQTKRKGADCPDQGDRAPEEYATHPSKQHKRFASLRDRSPNRRKPFSIQDGIYGDGNDDEEPSQGTSSGLAKDVRNERQTSTEPPVMGRAVVDPSKKYARRSRHKTKANRYEYKGDVADKSPVRRAMRRKHRRSSRKKTGDTLNQDFKAPNIEQERLTLRANTSGGIFGKGKASALLQTRGLPDLTFSEMTFLTKKRQPKHVRLDQHESKKPAKKQERSKEISDFFARPPIEAAIPRRTSSEGYHRHLLMNRVERSRSPVHSSSAKLTCRREASLGSRTLTPRRTEQSNRVSRPDQHSVTNEARSAEKGKAHGIPTVEAAMLPDQESTSYYSWSATKSRPSTAHNRDESPRLASHETAAPPSAQQLILKRPRQSPATNSSLDRYTKHLLLTGDHDFLQQSHREPAERKIFSLDDLKGLAEIAEIEDKYRDMLPTEHPGPNPGYLTRKRELLARTLDGSGAHQDRATRHLSYELGPTAPFPKKMFDNGNDMSGPLPISFQYQDNVAHYSVTSRQRSTNARYPVNRWAKLPSQLDQFIHRRNPNGLPDTHNGSYHVPPFTALYDIYESRLPPAHAPPEGYLSHGLHVNALNDYPATGIVNREASHPMHPSRGAANSYEPEMLFCPDAADSWFENGMPDDANSLDDMPELQGLQEAEDSGLSQDMSRNMLNDPRGVYGLVHDEFLGSSLEDDIGRPEIVFDTERRGLTWQQNASPYTREALVERFEGFSRPQVLY